MVYLEDFNLLYSIISAGFWLGCWIVFLFSVFKNNSHSRLQEGASGQMRHHCGYEIKSKHVLIFRRKNIGYLEEYMKFR